MSSILEVAGALISGVLSGGATGLLGIVIQQWGDNKKRAHDLELIKQQHMQTLELRRIEGEQALQMATVSAESAEKLAEIQAELTTVPPQLKRDVSSETAILWESPA
jgi:hypothetical protein